MSMAEKYPLTEKKVELRKPTYERWQYTLSGWLFMIRTPLTEEGKEMEAQICSRMWEDPEFDKRIRDEYAAWQAEEPETDWRMQGVEEEEDDIRIGHNKSIRTKGWKGSQRGKERRREP